jgi:hypothetical protein
MCSYLTLLLIPALAAAATTEATIHQGFRYQLPNPKLKWTPAAGLPSGLRVIPESAEIWGAPNEAGQYSFDLQASDGSVFTLDLKVNALWNVSLTPPQAGVGAPFSHRQVVAGGTPPYTFSADGLAPGLTISGDGLISGTPAKSGTYAATITAADHAGNTLTLPYKLTVNAVGIVTKELPFAEIDKPYSQQLVASGGKPPYTWKLDYRACIDIGPQLPVKQSFLNTGPPVFYRTPSPYYGIEPPPPPAPQLSADGHLMVQTPLPYDVFLCVQATDSAGNQAAASLTIVSLVPGDLPIDASIGIPEAISIGDPVVASVFPSDGTSPYEVTALTLPPGFAFYLINPDEAIVFGYPQSAGPQTIRIQVKDGTGAMVQRQASLHVSPIRVGAASGNDPTYGRAFSRQFYAVNAAPPYSWALFADGRFTSNGLPVGLSFTSAGLLSGTPLEAGYFFPTARVMDALGNSTEFQLLNKVAAPTPETVDLFTFGGDRPSLPLGREVLFDVYAAPVDNAPYSWTVTGALPPGMVEQDPASEHVTFWGVPSSGGQYPIQVKATDAKGNLGIRVIPLRVTSLHSDIRNLDPGITGQVNRIQLVVDGGTPPYRWSAAEFGLPPGMALSSDGVLSGVPTESRFFNINVSVSDAAANSVDLQFQWVVYDFLIAPLHQPVVIVKGLPFSLQLGARGGTPGYTWTLTKPDCLIDGLVFTTGGLLNGTPARSGVMTCDAVVTDAHGLKAELAFGFYVEESQPDQPHIPVIVRGTARVGQQLWLPVPISAAQPYTVAAAPGSEFPPGLSFDGEALTGYPATAGSYAFQIQVTDAFGQQATARAYVYVSPLHIVPGVPSGVYKKAYSYQFRIVEHVQPLLWTPDPHSRLPAGLTLSPTGLLSGVPLETGYFSFTVRVNDASTNVSLRIESGSLHTYNGGPGYTINVDTGRPVSISLYLPANTVTSVESGSLPPGLSLSSDGKITGVPDTTGAFTFSMRIDGDQGFGISVFTIRVGLKQSAGSVLSPATMGRLYAAQLQSGTLAPGESLPPGLTLSSDGKLSGTPTAPWLYQFSTLLDDAPGDSVISTYTLEVLAP